MSSNKLKIETDALEKASKQFAQLTSSLTDIAQQINRALSDVKNAAPTQSNIIASVASLKKRATSASNRSEKLASSVNQAADMWVNCELALATVIEESKSFRTLKRTNTTYHGDGSVTTETFEHSFKIGYMKDKHELDDEENDLMKTLYEKKGGDTTSKRKLTLFEIDAERKIGNTSEIFNVSGDNGWASGSVSAEYNTSEAHAKVAAGLYRTEVTADGKSKRYFEPGVSAEAGVSYSAFTVSADGQIGSDYLNAHGDVKVEAGQAEAKVKAELGYVNGSVRAKVDASAEVNVAKVEGKVGVNVAGAEVNVGASATVGIGAHAKVGYTDGKVSFDIGAAVGVGFSVNVEVDVSGVVDAVSSAWNTVTSWFSW